MADETPIVMGRIAGPYGIKGWVHVVSFTTPLDNLLDYRPWYLARDRRWQAVEVLEEFLVLPPNQRPIRTQFHVRQSTIVKDIDE